MCDTDCRPPDRDHGGAETASKQASTRLWRKVQNSGGWICCFARSNTSNLQDYKSEMIETKIKSCWSKIKKSFKKIWEDNGVEDTNWRATTKICLSSSKSRTKIKSKKPVQKITNKTMTVQIYYRLDMIQSWDILKILPS